MQVVQIVYQPISSNYSGKNFTSVKIFMSLRVLCPFNHDLFPNILIIANTIPIHKNDDNLGFNNYRPITVLSNIS